MGKEKSDVGTYFLAKSVDTSGAYLHMVVLKVRYAHEHPKAEKGITAREIA